MGTSSISSDFILSTGDSVVASSSTHVVDGAVSGEMVPPRALDLSDIVDVRKENAMNQWMMSYVDGGAAALHRPTNLADR
jgi:hypothetical protein